MDWIQVVVLAVLQGLTEFLPISSSAHLILLPWLVDWPDQGLAFDVAVHVGTLLAVIVYFRRDLWRMGRDWLHSLAARRRVGDSAWVWYLVVGTVPVGIGGLVVNAIGSETLRSPSVIAGATIFFALLLWWSDGYARGARGDAQIGWRDVLIIGAAQALALIPGTSRSGITITAGLALGLTRGSAARFSFLLSIPVVILAGLLEALEAWSSQAPVAWEAMFAGMLIAFACAYATIHFFLKLVERVGMFPFVIYRLVLGAVLLALVV
ncbi:MAG: undecaprenyl-diphosphate phosphatase [Gammaproteobacteria bacterium]|nr:MAG: undecaprenyl-diphosphate phosphatase [Gammaproteobacteria bacterium]